MNKPTKSGIRPLWIVLGLLLGVPALLCCGVGGWWVGRTSIAQGKLEEKKDELRSKGLPVDNQTLAEYYTQNTDGLYTGRWLGVLKTLDSTMFTDLTKSLPILGEAEVPAFGQPWPEQAQAEQLLVDYAGIMDELHEITDSDLPVRFPIDFDSFNTLLGEAQSMRQVSRLLALEHLYALRTGDADLEYESLDSLIGAATVLRNDPIFVSQLVSNAMHGIAVGAVQDSVRWGSMNDQQLSRIEQRLGQFDNFKKQHALAVAGERAFALPVFEEPGKLADPSMPATNVAGALGSRPIDALMSLEIYEGMERSYADDLDEFAAKSQAFDEEMTQKLDGGGNLQKFDTLLTRLMTPAIGAVGGAWIRQVVLNRMAKTGIAIKRYALARGEFPNSLDDLTEIGFDPADAKVLNGESLGYRIIDGMPMLWGYDFEQSVRIGLDSKIGDQPPAVDDGSVMGDSNDMWLWKFGVGETPKAVPDQSEQTPPE